MHDTWFVQRLFPGAVVSQVGDEPAVRDCVEPEFARQGLQGRAELLSTKVTPVRRVGDILRVGELRDANGLEANSNLRGFSDGLREFPAGESFRVRQDRERVVPERIV